MPWTWNDIVLKKESLNNTHGSLCLTHNLNMEQIMAALSSIGAQVAVLTTSVPSIDNAAVLTAISNLTISRVIPSSLTNGGSVTFTDGQTVTRSTSGSDTKYTITHPRDTTKTLHNLEYVSTDGKYYNVVSYKIEKFQNTLVLILPTPLTFNLRLTIFG